MSKGITRNKICAKGSRSSGGGSGSGLLPTIEITVDDIQVTDPTNLAVGQTYRVTSVGSGTSLPTGVDAVILTVTTTNGTSNQWSDLAQIYLTGTEFVWGRYDTSGNTIVKLLPRNTIDISQSDFFNLVDGDTYPPNGLVDGQFYLIHGNLGAGDPYSATIDHILIQAAYDQIYGLPVRPVSSAQAFVTSLQKYVPCQYDVIKNTVSGEYVLWAGYMSQTGSSDPIVDEEVVNISGETPAVSYHGTGNYRIDFTGGQLVSDTKCQTFASSNWTGSLMFLFNCHFIATNIYDIFSVKLGSSLTDGGLNKTYIQIKINL